MAQSQTDIAVIGAGPQALTLVTHILQKRAKLRDRIQVFDPSGTWLTQWQQQFAAQEIPELRSPAVHHPDPNAHALRTFAEGRYHELHPPYDRPGTGLFQEFCDTVVQRWQVQDHVTPAQVTRLEPLSKRPSRWRLTLSTGDTVLARRVVLATGGGQPVWPNWTQQINTTVPSERLCHASQVRLPALKSLAGETVLIVGSGLTSGHLAIGAVKRGAHVVMMARRTFQEKLFDAEPGWLGPKYLKGFHAEPDMAARWQMVQQARNGGSLTPAVMTQLRKLERQGHITFMSTARWRMLSGKGMPGKCAATTMRPMTASPINPCTASGWRREPAWISKPIPYWQMSGSATPSPPSTAYPCWTNICAGRDANCF
jgi:hypothetical protein